MESFTHNAPLSSIACSVCLSCQQK